MGKHRSPSEFHDERIENRRAVIDAYSALAKLCDYAANGIRSSGDNIRTATEQLHSLQPILYTVATDEKLTSQERRTQLDKVKRFAPYLFE